MQKRLFIYDVAQSEESLFSELESGDLCFSANTLVKHCIGCFACCTKTPGTCVIKDRGAVIASYLASSSEVHIVSPLMYGGLSQNIKAVMDRSIGYILPYFRIVNGEMHHQMRYDNLFALSAHFYGDCPAPEQDIARRLVQANAVNMGAGLSAIAQAGAGLLLAVG